MQNSYPNIFLSERTVEVPYITEKVKTFKSTDVILDVGGVETSRIINQPIHDAAAEVGCKWMVSDFRMCDFPGDFVTYNFGDKKFDNILFISSLEHFPQVTESDMVFRQDEDKKGFQKALQILKPGGKIYVTVPFGECKFQPYHQSFDEARIKFISEGAKMEESLIYILKDNNWVLSSMDDSVGICNPGPIYSVGLFTFSHAD